MAGTEVVAEMAVIGGSGFYTFLDHTQALTVETPFGPPSAPIVVGDVGGRRVAFLPRHGRAHEYPPQLVNYRANVWALAELGVTRLFAPCAVGSLRPDVHPGEVVVCDQLVDRTWGRHDTYCEGPPVNHVSFADPYCPELRSALRGALIHDGVPHHPSGTVVVIQGPRFSTRAESQWFRAQGWSVVNMTQYPEAVLARERGICYGSLALVTDYDSGTEGRPDVAPVTMAEVFAVLERNVAVARAVLVGAIAAVPRERSCACGGEQPGPA
jgi:5'-methylthioadenosine phosphorylase